MCSCVIAAALSAWATRSAQQTWATGDGHTVPRMLLDGVNHVAIITKDSERLHHFYEEVFDATVSRDMEEQPGVRLSFIDIGPGRELNVFEVEGNTEADRQTPMFGRGRIDHLALQAASKEAFDAIRERLIAHDAS